MSDYKSLTIFETIRRINGAYNGALYLPALQRHFVWPHDKICALFDSLMRDYPIGTFLFWEVGEQHQEESSFYSFIQDYSEFGDGGLNKPAGRSLPPKILGVLDGQQRLNSMFVALRGSYAYYDGGKGCPRTYPIYYKQRHFYLNVFGVPEEDAERKYEFALLTDDEVAVDQFTESKCWFKIGDLFYCASQEEVKSRWSKFRRTIPAELLFSTRKEARARASLKKLWRKICQEPIITYYPVRNRSLTEALEIFVRMNHGGVQLSFRDLLFSTIAANWKEGRVEIEKLERELNAVGNGFTFDVNSLMLACLVLSGNPVRMKIESFKPANVDRIREHWAEITKALTTAVTLVHRWSYSGNNAVSLNAVIAIAQIVRRKLDFHASESEMRMFLIRSLICGIYERRAERTLSSIRNYLEKVPEGAPFDLTDFMQKVELPPSLSLKLNSEKIDELLLTQIWHPRTYVLLSLLHGQHAVHQHAFEKDHIHPNSKFDNLTALNLGPEREAVWRDKKDRLPNLQLLQEGENNYKRAKPFKDWLPLYRPSEQWKNAYLAETDIPEDVSLDFADFENFFEKRRARLRARLADLLNVDIFGDHSTVASDPSPANLTSVS